MSKAGAKKMAIIYEPRTQMGPLVLIGKGLVLGGLTFKNRGYLGSRSKGYKCYNPCKWS